MKAPDTGVRLDAFVAAGLAHALVGDAAVRVTGVRHDSREVEPGDLFVAIPGQTADGARFAKSAIERGAVAVATESRLMELGVPQLLVDDAREALGALASLAYGAPLDELDVIGITGTNGKTTTAWILEQALTALGAKPALLGTVESRGPGFSEAAPFTTPEGDALARFGRRAVDAGASHLVMEVSSHALSMKRVEAVPFRVAAFTNLSQDHLDFHPSMGAYFEAKSRLFTDLGPAASVVHVGDRYGAALASGLAEQPGLLRVSRDDDGVEADLSANDAHFGRFGIRATLVDASGEAPLSSPLLGPHNLENLLVAAGILRALGYPLTDVADALGQSPGAPGRMERVEGLEDVVVLVDYAHTPDALSRALDALRPLTPGRLICVFGCGGDRDRHKRPLMGDAAARRCDFVVVTSDNPRTEDPGSILAEIEPSVASHLAAETGYRVLEDREAAIHLALNFTAPGDTVLIAGKGHEDYQIRGTAKIDFDDRVHAKNAIASMMEARP